MKEIKNTQTAQNLLKAFAGESMARNRYEFFAKVAEKEGFKQISAIFFETAEHERSHAKRFWKFLDGSNLEFTATYNVGKQLTTLENLRQSAEGENEEHSLLYPEFARVAKEEGFPEISAAFKLIAKVEAEHEKRFLKLLKNLEDNKIFHKDQVIRWICTKCGYVHDGTDAPQTCPACLHPQTYFEEYYF